MNKIKKTAAAGVALAATTGLVAGPAMMAANAWADQSAGLENGILRINVKENGSNADFNYGAFKIFDAKVNDILEEGTDNVVGKAATNLTWADSTDDVNGDESMLADAIHAVLVKAYPKKRVVVGDGTPNATYDADAGEWFVMESEYNGSKNAQDVADFLAEHWNDTTLGDPNLNDPRAILPSGSLGDLIAHAVVHDASLNPTRFDVDTDAHLSEGYYMIRGYGSSDPDTSSYGTSPIFVVVGDSDVEIDEKGSLPVVNKFVIEDSDGAEEHRKFADHNMWQEVTYGVTGTISENVTSFSKYQYGLVDELPENAIYVAGSARVYWGDYDITDSFVVTAPGDEVNPVLQIKCADLKQVGTMVPDPDAPDPAEGEDPVMKKRLIFDEMVEAPYNNIEEIVFTYRVQHTGDVANETGVENVARIAYSWNPLASEDNDENVELTAPSSALDYSYKMEIHKVDNSNGKLITNTEAVFTIQNSEGVYIGLIEPSTKKPVSYETVTVELPDGTQNTGFGGGAPGPDHQLAELDAETPYYFTTEDGIIELNGLDADEYTITEVKAPEGYNMLTDPFTVRISAADPEMEEGVITDRTREISTEVTNADALAANKSPLPEFAEYDEQGNEIDDAILRVKNVKNLNLPITGEQGIALLVLAGGAIVVGSAVALARGRRHQDDED